VIENGGGRSSTPVRNEPLIPKIINSRQHDRENVRTTFTRGPVRSALCGPYELRVRLDSCGFFPGRAGPSRAEVTLVGDRWLAAHTFPPRGLTAGALRTVAPTGATARTPTTRPSFSRASRHRHDIADSCRRAARPPTNKGTIHDPVRPSKRKHTTQTNVYTGTFSGWPPTSDRCRERDSAIKKRNVRAPASFFTRAGGHTRVFGNSVLAQLVYLSCTVSHSIFQPGPERSQLLAP